MITGENRERISPLFDVRAHLASFEPIAALFSLRYRFQASFLKSYVIVFHNEIWLADFIGYSQQWAMEIARMGAQGKC